MKNVNLRICSNDRAAENIYALTLENDCRNIGNPGRFIEISLDGFFLRRPFSICTWNSSNITLLYRVVGKGTEALSKKSPGNYLNVLMPLGNGFDTSENFEKPLLIGGGIGVPPLLGVAESIIEDKGIIPQVAMGFNSKKEIILTNRFKSLGIEPVIATADGSAGEKGFVTDLCQNLDYDYIFTCGPLPMLKSVYELEKPGQFSFEARMGCGFGVCMGCSIETKNGPKRVCKEGPVFKREEIIW